MGPRCLDFQDENQDHHFHSQLHSHLANYNEDSNPDPHLDIRLESAEVDALLENHLLQNKNTKLEMMNPSLETPDHYHTQQRSDFDDSHCRL